MVLDVWCVVVCVFFVFVFVFLETVNLELVVFCDADLLQKHAHIISLIALQLNDLAVLWMLDDGAVASKVLLERTHEFLLVEFFANALHGRQCLATITLLNTYVNETRTRIEIGCAQVVQASRRVTERI